MTTLNLRVNSCPKLTRVPKYLNEMRLPPGRYPQEISLLTLPMKKKKNSGYDSGFSIEEQYRWRWRKVISDKIAPMLIALVFCLFVCLYLINWMSSSMPSLTKPVLFNHGHEQWKIVQYEPSFCLTRTTRSFNGQYSCSSCSSTTRSLTIGTIGNHISLSLSPSFQICSSLLGIIKSR
jgi:hypothetical protein